MTTSGRCSRCGALTGQARRDAFVAGFEDGRIERVPRGAALRAELGVPVEFSDLLADLVALCASRPARGREEQATWVTKRCSSGARACSRGSAVAAEETRLEVSVPADLVDAIATRAAELAADMVAARPEPWIGVDAAAAFLACPRSRIYSLVSARRIPHCHDGSRVLFKASDLDQWVRDGGGIRP